MTDILEFMADDHDRLDEILANYKLERGQEIDRARTLFADLRAGLLAHIAWEEDILFPLFEERSGTSHGGPTAVMRQEHRTIENLMAEIAAKLERGDAGTEELEGELEQVLEQHHFKEESILYPAIDELLSAEERQETLGRIEELSVEGSPTRRIRG